MSCQPRRQPQLALGEAVAEILERAPEGLRVGDRGGAGRGVRLESGADTGTEPTGSSSPLLAPVVQRLAGTARLRPRIVTVRPVRIAHADTRRQGTLAHLFELRPGRHLLGEQRRLDAVEQPLEPADELGLRDPQFGVGRNRVVAEGQGEPFEFVAQFGGEALFELADRGLVDLLEPGAAGVVERCGPDLLEQLLDHGADAHDLGRLLDHVGQRRPAVAFGVRGGSAPSGSVAAAARGWPGLTVGTDHDDVFILRVRHDSIMSLPAPLREGASGLGRVPPCWTSHSRWLTSTVLPWVLECRAWLTTSPGFGASSRLSATVGSISIRRPACRFRTRYPARCQRVSARRPLVIGRHVPPRRSAAILDAARQAVADLVGGDPAGVVLGPDRPFCWPGWRSR